MPTTGDEAIAIYGLELSATTSTILIDLKLRSLHGREHISELAHSAVDRTFYSEVAVLRIGQLIAQTADDYVRRPSEPV